MDRTTLRSEARSRGRFYPIGEQKNNNKMTNMMRIFTLLLKKNLTVRKKKWGQTYLIQIGISVGLFLLAELIRLLADEGITVINHDTYHDPKNSIEILQNFPRRSAVIHYTPQFATTKDFMESVRLCLKVQESNVFGSPDEATMLAEIARDQSIEKEDELITPIGIVFETIVNDSLPTIFKYKIRTSFEFRRGLYDPLENGDDADLVDDDPMLPVQICLDKVFIEKMSKNKTAYDTTMFIQQMPYPPYNKIGLADYIGAQALAEFARLMLVIVTCVEMTFPANEKNIGINILMSVNGVKNQTNLLSWLVTGAIWSTSYLLPIVLLLKFFYPPHVAPFLDHGNPFIVWLALLLQTIQTFCFGYHLSSYFWKPSYGVFAVFMASGLMNTVKNFATGSGIKHILLYAGIFSPNFLLDRIFNEINAYERQLTGVGFLNMFVVGASDSSPEASIGVMLIFSIIGAIFHFYMAIYIHSIRPGKYGVKQHPLFCFQRSNKVQENQTHLAFEELQVEKKEFESVPEGSLEPGIRIRGLKKSYTTDWIKKTTVHALKGVSIDFYKSQITALLGHNGAGKTTMMSILSGLVSSTEGVVFIDGKNIQADPETIRKNIGLCPQVNIVFPDLNVFEQLVFFGTLKADNKSTKQLEEEIEILLSKVNLSDKKYALPDQLSGGQKRRLCLAMAVIGDANVLILDEPTSGMDAESKREVWDIILKMRGYKTILISTHDMEEADILGDRIAIMHSGQLKSYGTAMFLKNLYGDGQVEVTLSVDPGCNVAKISEEIEINVNVLSEGDGKIVLAIPKTESLPEALDKLESSKKKLGITGMSVSIITLEQVFLKITKEEGDEMDTINNPIRTFEKESGFTYFMQTFWGYLIKKFAYARKNPWSFWISLLLPCCASLLLLLAFGAKTNNEKPIKLTLNAYSSSKALVKSSGPSLSAIYSNTIRDFGGKATIIDSQNSVTTSLLNFAKENKVVYRNKMIVSAEFNRTANNLLANGFYSGTAIRGIPITINCISNTLVKHLTDNEAIQIHISSQQLPKNDNKEAQSTDASTVTLSMIIFLAPAIAFYVTHPLSEATSGIKQLQDMTGASKISYWGSMFIFDYCQYVISVLLLLASFLSIDIFLGTQFYYGKEMMLFFALLLLFGLGSLPLVYAISFWKLTQNATMIILSVSPMVLGFIDTILAVLSFTLNSKYYDHVRDIQKHIFLLIPDLSFLYGHYSFFQIVVTNARCRRMTDNIIHALCSGPIAIDECCSMECSGGVCKKPKSYFESNFLGPSLGDSMFYMVVSSVIFFALIFIFEQQIIDKILIKIRRQNLQTSTIGMDELVQNEKEIVGQEVQKRVDNTVENDNVFLAHELKKNYGKLQVVKGISFRVKEGECFGLLGVNGAGKSTTFKMLTGIELPHDGTMYLKNYGIHNNRGKYLAEMGYCPQQDAIIDTLNAWDHLNLFARLRGVPTSQIHFVVRNWIIKLNLTACASQPSATYSGGNRRRLNIAMALIGNPALVLMDEPTTGVDPAARRSLWNTLKACQEFGQSIILTSHSMEECEVLCNRLVIMVKGQIVCVGAVQELKQRFGAGYNIHVKLSTVSRDDDIQEIKRRIESGISCQKMDENSGFLGYHVTDSQVSWTFMYDLMNTLKNTYSCIEDFAVLSSTLEQLFIQFARAPDDIGNGELSRNSWRNTSSGSPV
ncbi:hypothetical protein HCN44_001587 [Aphidius gifuensis]|uniref:ABC transporter domain-containing protein n=1 Tax=Aphidius gifuensis TaxID=684658 RepID=A0A834XTJ4_APHGI|nr:hypothetical protein HCN44_001587 [Aphidius gifuensis]